MLAAILLLGALPAGAFAADILKTNGFSNCLDNGNIKVEKMDIQYNRQTNKVTFDVAGTSAISQEVMAALIVTAYGREVYRNEFNPCEEDSRVDQLCPIPSGTFEASGSQSIPSDYASKIPSIAFSIPDLDGAAKLELRAVDSGEEVACIQSVVGNGITANVPAVPYIAAGIAGAALLVSGLSALAGVNAGGAVPSPTFGEVIGYFQSIAMNGMLSVQYPSVYRSFSNNFAFSGGLIYWESMQKAIDSFRDKTGGNLTENSVEYLKHATLIYEDTSKGLTKRGLEAFALLPRQLNTSINGSSTDNSTDASDIRSMHSVSDFQAYVETLAIPEANTFMTVLLIFAIVVAAITVGILLFKVILEAWALFGKFPENLKSFRKRYWLVLAKTITNLILLLYGIWTLYCVYQFTNGDSWAAKTLAGVTLAIFTAILGYFTFRIWQIAHRYKKTEGDASGLYDNKETWTKYSLFYENYKKGYWWLFIPCIVYMFAKGCVIAAGNGHGIVQAGGQLIIESLLLILLLWSRPYTLKSGNWINIVIQVVRVLSVACILVFVHELGIDQTTKTITGVALIAVQSILAGILAILIAVNAIIICCKQNPHRRRRKEAEKYSRDLDNLTPLDARNSLLLTEPATTTAHDSYSKYSAPTSYSRPLHSPTNTSYSNVAYTDLSRPPNERQVSYASDESSRGLLDGGSHLHDPQYNYSAGPPMAQEPHGGYRGHAV